MIIDVNYKLTDIKNDFGFIRNILSKAGIISFNKELDELSKKIFELKSEIIEKIKEEETKKLEIV